MNTKTAEILCKLNTEFYNENSLSFAQTRQASWPGWRRGLEIVRQDFPEGFPQISVFDLACGNLRFEAFLKKEFDDEVIDIYAVDNCEGLIPHGAEACFQSVDIMEAILSGTPISDRVKAPLCDISVSFGFMHHVPGQEYRKEVLKSLIRQTRPSGYVMVSLWQFLNNAELAKKAAVTHEEALKSYSDLDLDEGDYLLGWKNLPDIYRYCHSFSESEIDQLILSVEKKAKLLARYTSDGRGDDLNTYLIFKVLDVTTDDIKKADL